MTATLTGAKPNTTTALLATVHGTHGITMRLRAFNGVMKLDVRKPGSFAWVAAKHPAPVYAPSGRFNADTATARTWLAVHKNGIMSRELSR